MFNGSLNVLSLSFVSLPSMFSFFATSSLPVYQNYIKNILFRVATLLIQLSILKLFSFLAFKSNAYTSFLMFNEDHMQKLLFVRSRGLTRHGLLVLAFALFFGFGNLYDTLLWALDSPGYIAKTTLVTALTATNQLLADPAYIVYMSNPTGHSALDIDQAVTGNLFVQGFNFTLPKPVPPGPRDIVSTNQTITKAGPRIWLDDTGFSVGVDELINVTPSIRCPVKTVNANLQIWNCEVNNTDTWLVMSSGQAARPQIWWDNSPFAEDHFLSPDRRDNPWMSLGVGGDTAVMKQVFTVTKENRRHTFLQTVLKVTMITLYPTPFNDSEITDIVRRFLSDDPRQPLTPEIKAAADLVISAQTNQTSLTFGASQQEAYSVTSSRIEFFNVMNAYLGTERLISSLRLIFTNITLIRSETLPNPIMPYGPACPNFSANIATGGRVRFNDCYMSIGNQTDAHFLGQLDTSAVFILTDVLGDGKRSTSAAALNQTGVDWYLRNAPHIDDLLIARGLILGGDSAAVPLAMWMREPAISYLQLFLLLLSAALAIVAMVLITLSKSMGYYTNSFLAAVCATMHIDGRNEATTCTKAGYLHEPPEIKLVTTQQHVVISISDRVLTTVVEGDEKVVSGDDDESR